MTREESVEVLTRLEISNFRIRSGKTYLTEALIMAINALMTEPCEDCISRQAVIDIIEREPFKGDALSEIEKLPSVQPEPFINKPCISEGACREDKKKVLEKIKAEMQDIMIVSQDEERIYQEIKAIIDKHIAESEECYEKSH